MLNTAIASYLDFSIQCYRINRVSTYMRCTSMKLNWLKQLILANHGCCYIVHAYALVIVLSLLKSNETRPISVFFLMACPSVVCPY